MNDPDGLALAVGRRMEATEQLAVAPARRLAATFDRPENGLEDGASLPPGWHWLYFLDAPRTALLGEDGRTVPGGFLPETGLPRRMWAGGRFEFHGALRLGLPALCTTTLVDARRKEGRSGSLAFLTTRHAVSQDGDVRVEEHRDLVFRAAPGPDERPQRQAAPTGAVWRRTLTPDPVLLFRFSALTFNAHRIHYDLEYCRTVEGYPGLVVHGPMMALLMLDLLQRELPDVAVGSFDYRAAMPVFAGSPIHVCGRPSGEGADLWIEARDGALVMSGRARLV